MPKNLEIRKRIAILAEKLEKPGNTLGVAAGLGNGTIDKWTDKHLDVSNVYVEKFLRHFNISHSWWITGDGSIFLSPEEKSNGVEKNKKGIYQIVTEGGTEYYLIPRRLLDTNDFIPKDELTRIWNEIEKKNIQIEFFEEQIDRLLDKLGVASNVEKFK